MVNFPGCRVIDFDWKTVFFFGALQNFCARSPAAFGGLHDGEAPLGHDALVDSRVHLLMALLAQVQVLPKPVRLSSFLVVESMFVALSTTKHARFRGFPIIIRWP